ncbi:MAG: hypothetical protein NVSMB13_07480 [Mycobacteriales bacterium]
MTPRQPCRVLVADDAADLRDLLCLLLDLEDDFVVVGQASDGEEAIRLSEQQQPDLVVLDLAMPVMDGLQALPQVRRVAPATKVVIFSGFETGSVARQARACGADGYIEKGTGVIDLVARLREICLERRSC